MKKSKSNQIRTAMKNKKSLFKKGTAIASVAAAASSMTVPAYTVYADENSKENENNAIKSQSKSFKNPVAKERQAGTKKAAKKALYHPFQKQTMKISASAQNFVNKIGKEAAQVAANNDLYASVMIAQAMLESAHGKSLLAVPPNHNLFGIKGEYNGESVSKITREDDGSGNLYSVVAQFRKYPSYIESFQDYAHVLRHGPRFNPAYYAGTWKSNAKTYLDATNALTGTYATDINYANKLNALIETYDLTRFDGVTPNGKGLVTNTYHKIAPGDSLYELAKKYDTTVKKLKEWNQLKDDKIYAGDKLIVKVTVLTPPPLDNRSDRSVPLTHVVKKEETLHTVAAIYKVPVSQLRAWNQLQTDILSPGQKLIIKIDSRSSRSSFKTYTIRKGDTLWGISQKYGVSITDLKTWNNLKTSAIYVDQKLLIGQK